MSQDWSLAKEEFGAKWIPPTDTIPDGFVDTSWHNDMCPSITLSLPNKVDVIIYIDFPELEDRDFPDEPRFCAVKYVDDDYHSNVGSSDDFEEVVKWARAVQ